MKNVLWIAAGVVMTGMGLWFGLYPQDWQNWLGFSHNAYFIYGTNYAFTSGPGPMLETGIGMSTIVGGLWHAHNCHEDGCLRIGKHKVNGTPWCNQHHEAARHAKTIEQLVEEQIAATREQTEALRQFLDRLGGISGAPLGA